jgi:hypothetical protein
VTLSARWVTLRARWVPLRARWVTLRARRVTLGFESDVGTRTSFDFINQQHTKAFLPRVRAALGGQAPASLRSPLRNSTVCVS